MPEYNEMGQPSPSAVLPQTVGAGDGMVDPPQQSQEAMVLKLLNEVNIADSLDDKKLEDIGQKVFKGYQTDLQSRSDWEKQYETWMKLATLVAENKTWPWNKASNVKYPLIATAAMQFSARAYPTLLPSNGKVVQVEVIGEDPLGIKVDKAERLSKHMSYQLLKQMPSWEEDMDRMLIILPIVGTCFKKTYWDSVNKRNCSEVVLPKDLIVNYYSKSLEESERLTERIEISPRKLKERQLNKIFLDIELAKPQINADKKPIIPSQNPTLEQDDTLPYILLEQHTYEDLDDDGYPEPYVITIEENSKKVLRIAPRYGQEEVKLNEQNDIIKIDPIHYYTKYGFIPNPDGGFYDIGFGLLLGPLNESVNTLINQLVDAGTISNLQSGFIGKGLRLKPGEQRFTPGEWKPVNATGDDLRKQIVPLPAKEPSTVLFQLLGTLITSGKELASVAEIFVGKMPGQNTPATTTMASIEQGMKVFTAIYKRVYRALSKEYKKLFKLNSVYLDYKEYVNVLDAPVDPSDYDLESYDVCPAADPAAISSTEKLIKAQGLLELLPLGTIDPLEVTRRVLDAQDQPNPDKLFRQGPPPPDPKVQEAQMKMQIEQTKAQTKMQMDQMKMAMQQRESEFKLKMEAAMKQMEMTYKEKMMQLEAKERQMEMMFTMRESQMNEQTQSRQNEQKIRHGEEQHTQKMQQMKDNPKKKETK